MNRAEKTDAIAKMTETVGRAPHAFLIDFQGINVPDVTELRRQVRATGSEYVVLKNTLALRAFKDAPIGALSEHFTGMTAVAYSKTDIVQLAKVLHQFGKTNPKVKVKAALVEGRPVPGHRARVAREHADAPGARRAGSSASCSRRCAAS